MFIVKNMTGIKCILSAYLLAYFLVFRSIFACIFHSFLGHELSGPTYYVKRLSVRKINDVHDACTSWTSPSSPSSIVAALNDGGSYSSTHRLWSAVYDKVLNAQSKTPIDIHRQLCQVYGYTQLDIQHISSRSSAGSCLIMHPIDRTSQPVIPVFSYTSRNSCPASFNVFRMT